MLNSILGSSGELSIENLLICSLVSILLGLLIAFVHMKTSRYGKNFLVTLAVLPILVQSVILMTNGNLGTSLAIVGTFSLVRFRSVPGTSKEIMSIFFAMTIGLASGMGHLVFAGIVTVIVSFVIILLSKTKFGEGRGCEKILKITIPENLDYETVFDDIFQEYLNSFRLDMVKTVNLGSLFELSYSVNIKKNISEKEFIDEIRSRNGNLKICLSHPMDTGEL